MNLSQLATLTLFATSTAFAQLLPPSAATDGIYPESAGLNSGFKRWASPTGLGAYRAGSAPDFVIPAAGAPDAALGLTWGTTGPATAGLNAAGGIARLIFIQATPGATGAVGYAYSGNPLEIGDGPGAGAFTAWDSLGERSFGDHLNVRLEAGEIGPFDFWAKVNAAAPASLLHTNGPVPDAPFVSWTQTPLAVTTFLGFDTHQAWDFGPLDTYLVALHDVDGGVDALLALQLVPSTGGPLGAVPEPAAYGVAGAALLLGVVIVRRRRLRRRSANEA